MSDTGSDDSDADDEEEFIQNQKQANEWLTEEEDSVPNGPPRTKNELAFDNSHIYDPDALDNIIEAGSVNNKDDIHTAVLGFDRNEINSSIVTDELNEIGTIMCRMDEENTLVVQASYTESPLNEGSLLFFKEKVVLGKICEIFGPITTPFYVVRWAAPSSASVGSKGNRAQSVGEGTKRSANKKGKKKRCDKNTTDDNAAENAAEGEPEGEQAGDSAEKVTAKAVGEIGVDAAEAVIDEEAKEGEVDGETTLKLAFDEIIADDSAVSEIVEEDAAVTVDMNIDETLTAAPPMPMTVEEHDASAIADNVDAPMPTGSNTCLASSVRNTVASTAQKEHFASLISRALPGTPVYSASRHMVVITASSLSAIRKQGKGTDASNIYDEEIADDEKEFSDDEEELLAKQERNRSKRGLGSSGDSRIKLVHPAADRGADWTTSAYRGGQNISRTGVCDNNSNNGNSSSKTLYGVRYQGLMPGHGHGHGQDQPSSARRREPDSFLMGLPQQSPQHQGGYPPHGLSNQSKRTQDNSNMFQPPPFISPHGSYQNHSNFGINNHDSYNSTSEPYPQYQQQHQHPLTGDPFQPQGFVAPHMMHLSHLSANQNQNQSNQGGPSYYQSTEAWQHRPNPHGPMISNGLQGHHQEAQQQHPNLHYQQQQSQQQQLHQQSQQQQSQQRQQQQQQQSAPYHFPTHIQQSRQHVPIEATAPSMPWAGFGGSGTTSAPQVSGLGTGPGLGTGTGSAQLAAAQRPLVYTYQPIQYDQQTSKSTGQPQKFSGR